ncbi:MAG: aminoacyltransferase [Candidatus Cloacimonetes bacterium]|nr:aminoacyltransferase [Candidatus Cloacimonadota bacterium]
MTINISHNLPEEVVWGEFEQQFSLRNIFHSLEMNRIFQRSGYRVFPVIAYDNDKICAAAFGVLVKVKSAVSMRFLNRILLYGAPLFSNNETGKKGLSLVLENLRKLGKKHALFVEIRNHEPLLSEISPESFRNWEYFPYQNYIVDLSKGKESIWECISKYARNHVRKAEKKGVVIRELTEQEFLKAVNMMEKLYNNKNIPFIGQNIFHQAWKVFKPSGKIYAIGAFLEEKMIGARFSLPYAETLFDWYAASDRAFSKYYPNEALAWATIAHGCDLELSLFDFGGGSLKGQFYGPGKFKEKFHGKIVEYGRWRNIGYPTVFKLLTKLYEWRKKG